MSRVELDEKLMNSERNGSRVLDSMCFRRLVLGAPLNVCFWHKADISTELLNVRFRG